MQQSTFLNLQTVMPFTTAKMSFKNYTIKYYFKSLINTSYINVKNITL